MPPVSNVMPLPTSATVARGADPPDQRSRTSRGLRDEPCADPEHAAVAARGERGVVEHLDLEPGRLGQLARPGRRSDSG